MLPIRAWISFGVFLVVIGAGAVGFHQIEKLSWIDSLYFTIVTITTVGYGDISPATAAGKLFATIVVVVGVSSALTTLTLFFGSVFEETIRRAASGIAKPLELRNHVVICGTGPLAEIVSEELRLNKVPYALISPEPVRMAEAVVVGDPSEKEVLHKAGVERAISLVCLVEEPDNAFIILEAKRLNQSLRVITVVKDPDNRAKLQDIGADVVIAPQAISARLLALSSESHFSLEFFDRDLSPQALTLNGVVIPRTGPAVGRSLEELDIPKRFGVSVVAISRGNELKPNPDPSEKLEAGCQVVVFGDRSKAIKFKQWATAGKVRTPEILPRQAWRGHELAREVRVRGPRLVVNAFLIAVILVLRPLISPLFFAAGLALHLQNVFTVASDVVVLAAIGYLLFFSQHSMIRDLKALAEVGALAAGGLDGLLQGEGIRRVLRNVVLIITMVVLGSLVGPFLASLGGLAGRAGTLIPWICLGLLLVVMYDMGAFLYSNISRYVSRLANNLANQLEEEG